MCNAVRGGTGTPDNFLKPGAPVDEIKTAEEPTKIKRPNGNIKKTTCVLPQNIWWSPQIIERKHIVHDLRHSSLVTMKTCAKMRM